MTYTSYGKVILNPRRIFLLSVLLFVMGDILGIVWDEVPFLEKWYLLISGLILISVFFLLLQKKVWIFFLFLSIFWCGLSLGSNVKKEHLESYRYLSLMTREFTEKKTISGTIEKELYRKDRSRTFLMKIDNFDNFDKTKDNPSIEGKNIGEDVETSIFLEIPSNLTLTPGEKIEVTGKIRKNISFPLKGFSRYAFFQGWYGYLFTPTFHREGSIKWWFFSSIVGYWRELFESGFPREIAGTLLGMTLGSFELLPSDLKASFVASGISHILVVSGSNIALLIVFIVFFLKYLHIGKIGRIGIVSFCIIFYVLLVGPDISIIRAAIMGIIGYIAVEWGDRISSRATLWLALIVATLIEPLGPLYDAGFGLSFSATLGIILFQKNITRWLWKYHIPTLVSSSVAITLGASLWSLPILLYHFWEIPVWSIITNILIAGFLGWILFSGIIYAGFSLISSWLSYIFGFLVYLPTYIVIRISRIFDSGYILSVSEDIALIISLSLLGLLSFFFVYDD
jgi:ComEC/Rec2-related protein